MAGIRLSLISWGRLLRAARTDGIAQRRFRVVLYVLIQRDPALGLFTDPVAFDTNRQKGPHGLYQAALVGANPAAQHAQ
jgi:hypothetical protein